MSNVKATMSTNGTLNIQTGVNKAIVPNTRVSDSKTGTAVSFVGKSAVYRKTLKCPFVFVDLDTLETRRHSAAYIAKYIG